MLKILIVDDHIILRQGLKRILIDQYPEVLFGEAGTVAEAESLITQQQWDIVILDINIPGRSGLDILHDLKKSYPQLPFLVLSMYPEKQFAVRAMKAGASGYLTKDSAADDLVFAIEQLRAGKRYITPAVAEVMAEVLNSDSDKSLLQKLSDREYAVLCLIGKGNSVSQIAEHLALSVKTISTYRSNLLHKLGLNNTTELIRFALTNGLVE